MIAFDIETVPLLTSLEASYPELDRMPPGTMSKPETIAAWRVRDELAWREGLSKKCSLNPRLGRVVCIAYADGVNSPNVDVAFTEADEARVLVEFWRLVREHRQIAGWNSMGFDLPFLFVRSLLNGVEPGLDLAPYLRRYSYTPHLDAKCAVLQWNDVQAGEGLDEWSKAFGMAGKIGHGSEVAGMVERKAWGELSAYAAQDAAATLAIATKVAPLFGVSV